MRHRLLPIVAPTLLMALSLIPTGAAADVGSPLSLTCPQSITTGNDLDECSAMVTFPAPTPAGGNGAVTVACDPPSGSTFPVGTTTVNCTATDPSGQTATCFFTVTVQDV